MIVPLNLTVPPARRLTNCATCGGTMYIDAPHPDPAWAAAGATQMQPCPACNAADLPTCPVCGDAGFVRLDLPVDHPQFGVPVPCPANCAAVRQQRRDHAERLRRVSRLPEEYLACTFAAFDALPAAYRQGKLEARRAAQLFVETSPDHRIKPEWLDGDLRSLGEERRNWLIFTGPHGRGKTGMAASIVNHLTAAGASILYIRLQDAFTAIQRRYREDWQALGDRDDFALLSSTAVLDEIRFAPVLVLDEWFISDRAETQDKRDKLEAIMRYRSAERLPTVITTNHTLDMLEDAWGTTTLSVVRARSFVIPVRGLPLRPDAIHIGEVS